MNVAGNSWLLLLWAALRVICYSYDDLILNYDTASRTSSKWEIESSLMSQKFHLLYDSFFCAIELVNVILIMVISRFVFSLSSSHSNWEIIQWIFVSPLPTSNVVNVVIVVSGKWMEGKCKRALSATAIAHKMSGWKKSFVYSKYLK